MAVGLDAVRYSAANARVRGLASQLLSEEIWQALIAAEDLGATLNILHTTVYADVAAELEAGGAVTLEDLERHLHARAAQNIRRAMAFVSGARRNLLQVWWQHFELENLKALFRGFDQGLPPDAIRHFLIPLDAASQLPWDALLHTQSVAGLVDRLGNTHYGQPLRNALPSYRREQSLFAIEIALDIRYYRDLAAAINALGGADLEDARRILGTRLDILNILWAYRHRVYYRLSAEEIINYTLWHTFRTDTRLIRDIALGAAPEDILERVWGRGTVDLSLLEQATTEAAMVTTLELILERFWWGLARSAMGGYPFRLGALLGYVVLQETEIVDLVTLLEAKTMRWDRERVCRHLVRCEE
ncbi:MAG TPA: V-type ATPase subunit [Chloroflexi bacterium]|jgi:V/A-type H+-transporting ATPase subunit C|nr:V-type ATPase subunit [Chloroflexota bacterium]